MEQFKTEGICCLVNESLDCNTQNKCRGISSRLGGISASRLGRQGPASGPGDFPSYHATKRWAQALALQTVVMYKLSNLLVLCVTKRIAAGTTIAESDMEKIVCIKHQLKRELNTRLQ